MYVYCLFCTSFYRSFLVNVYKTPKFRKRSYSDDAGGIAIVFEILGV